MFSLQRDSPDDSRTGLNLNCPDIARLLRPLWFSGDFSDDFVVVRPSKEFGDLAIFRPQAMWLIFHRPLRGCNRGRSDPPRKSKSDGRGQHPFTIRNVLGTRRWAALLCLLSFKALSIFLRTF